MASLNSSTTAVEERFKHLEDPGVDFPYFNGAPTAISNRQWLFVLAMVVLGFLVLACPLPWPSGPFWPFVRAILLPAIPLVALAIVAPGHWKAIFGKVGGREVKLMSGFAFLNIVVSFCVGALVHSLTEVTPNPAMAQLSQLDTAERIAFLAKTIPQLLGEEVITLLPFLAFLQWLSTRWGMGRKGAIIGAWLATSLVFGLIHLPTYDWNWIQCIFVIGTARLILTLPWIMTKNIWVSTGAHIVNDWTLFGMGLMGAAIAIKS